MPPSELRCTAPGVGERLGVAIGQAGIIDPEGGSALCVDFGVAVHGRALQHDVGVMAQRRDLIRIDHAFENIEPLRMERLEDVGMQFAVVAKPQRTAVSDGLLSFLAGFSILK